MSSDALNKMRMRWGVGARFCPTVKFSTRRGHECIPGKQPGQRMQSIASGCGGPLFRLLSKGPFWSSDTLNKKRMRSGRGFIPGSIYNISQLGQDLFEGRFKKCFHFAPPFASGGFF